MDLSNKFVPILALGVVLGILATTWVYSTLVSGKLVTRPTTGVGKPEAAINNARVRNGKRVLRYSRDLDVVAGRRAARMQAGGISHVGLNAARRKLGVPVLGEVLATTCGSPKLCTKLWLLSPAHREVVLDPKWKKVAVNRQGNIRVALFTP